MWRRVGFLLFCAYLPLTRSFGQTKADSISGTAPKFLIRNRRGQILLVFDPHRQAWEVPGTAYAGPITFQNLLDGVAKEYGISYKNLTLSGLFTYHYPARYKTVVRPYFTAVFTGFRDGKNFSNQVRLQWVDPDQIKHVLLYPASVMIVEQVVKAPKTVWAGAFEEYGYTTPMTDSSVVKFRVIEPLYKLK